jgi:hypothetical protein
VEIEHVWAVVGMRCGHGAALVVVDSVDGSWCDVVLRVELGCGMGQTCKCHAPVWCATATACGPPWRAFGALVALAIGEACRQSAPYHLVGCIAKDGTVRRIGRSEISHNGDVATTSAATRDEYVRRGRQLEYFTIGYNSLEGVTSIVAGFDPGSVSLIGFGLDSLIEVTSAAALLWRLRHDLDISRCEHVERTALRTVGACFVALALYILCESSSMLIYHVSFPRNEALPAS